jgi:Tol biopolymer transport system component
VAPDGRKVLLGVADQEEHVWVYDLAEGTLRQLTFEASNPTPIWSADGRQVTFASNRHGAMNLFTVPAGGDGAAERLTISDSLQRPGSWSPDGEVLAFVEQHPSTGRDIWLRRRNGERTPWAAGEADESAPRLSPDGSRIAYVSNESGEAEVYVRALNGSGPVRRVSTSGGSEPVWRRDGTALYFRSYGRVFEAPLGGGAHRVVFDGAAEPGTFDAAGYDVIGNTARFLMITSNSPNVAPSELRVILNWRPVAPA